MENRTEMMTNPDPPLPLYERMSFLIYAGALFALFCIVHEPDTGVSSMNPVKTAQTFQLEPSRDFPPQHHQRTSQPASARSPLTNTDSIKPHGLSQLKQFDRPRRDGID
jgi:hypothetical protein